MPDNAELHQKMVAFLMGEWNRKDERQLVGVDLFYSPGQGYKDEEIRKWERADEPEFFAEYVNIEKLAGLIIEIAEGDVDTRLPRKHRYFVRTRQHMGSKPTMPFALYPAFHGHSDETAIVTDGSGGGGGGGGGKEIAVAQILAQNNGQLMRTNQQMFDGTIRVLGHQNQNMHEQIIALRDENAKLRMDLEEAKSNKNDREFQMAMAAEKNIRTNQAFQKMFQLGTVLVSKFAADGTGPQQLGEGAPLPMLVNELKTSLRPDQVQAVMGILDMPQKILFMEIIKLASPPEQGPPQGQPPRPPGGPSGTRP